MYLEDFVEFMDGQLILHEKQGVCCGELHK